MYARLETSLLRYTKLVCLISQPNVNLSSVNHLHNFHSLFLLQIVTNNSTREINNIKIYQHHLNMLTHNLDRFHSNTRVFKFIVEWTMRNTSNISFVSILCHEIN